MTFKRLLLVRRRFDDALLASGFAMLALLFPVGKAVFAVFMVAGFYLACIGHRTRRHVPRAFSLAVVVYTLWFIVLTFVRGESFTDNRDLGYTLIVFSFVFLPLGLCLVPRPLDQMVFGARLGVIAAGLLSLIQFELYGQRVGLGGNEAVFGFTAAVIGLVSRLEAKAPPAWLPNTRTYFYLSFLAVMMSETRAAWFVYVLVALFDLVTFLRSGRFLRAIGVVKDARPTPDGNTAPARPPGKRWRWALTALVVAAAALPVVNIASDRFASGLSEFSTYQVTGSAAGSVNVRLAMWQSAVGIIGDHPIVGVGGTRRIAAVAAGAGVTEESAAAIRQYRNLHNLFVDQILTSGLVGLFLLLCVFSAFLWTIFALTRTWRMRETAISVVFLVATYGSFHGVLLNEWNLILVFGFMGVLMTDLMRRRVAENARLPGRN